MEATELVEKLGQGRAEFCFPPSFRPRVEGVALSVLGLLFPHFADRAVCDTEGIAPELARIDAEFRDVLCELGAHTKVPDGDLAGRFLGRLGDVHDLLVEDAQAIFDGDPAATSLDEVILVYPGFFAIASYRIAHELHRLRIPLVPRLVTEWAHTRTGVDIHPGARIGRRFFIDHGTGVVIGETTDIGDDVKLYQGVTLGALSVAKGMANSKRHPTLQDRVVVYSHATILGGATTVGHDSLIGGNVWLTESVPSHSVVTRPSEVNVRNAASLNEVLNWII